MIWAVFAFLIVAIVKYLTSLRLRKLRQKIQQDRQATEELKRLLEQATDKESVLQTEIDGLIIKATALKSIVSNLERALQRPRENAPPPSS